VPDIMHHLTLQVPPERVYDALTTAAGIRNWWTRDTELDPRVGGIGTFSFHNGADFKTVRVEELVPPSRVVWKPLTDNRPQWLGTTIAFDLKAEDGGTDLTFTQRGYPEADDVYACVTTAWAYFLFSLKRYLETGTGLPHPGVDFANVIGSGNQRHVFQTYIRTTPERLWSAIVEPKQTARWFFGGHYESEWTPGSPLVLRHAATGRMMLDNTLIAAEAPRRLDHTFKPAGSPNPASKVSWEIRPNGDVCLLEVIHDYADAHPEAEGTKANWAIVLSGLKTYLETGTSLDLPMAQRETANV
jgi:uncharacterized protein YndB with AHSA1/START domain